MAGLYSEDDLKKIRAAESPTLTRAQRARLQGSVGPDKELDNRRVRKITGPRRRGR